MTQRNGLVSKAALVGAAAIAAAGLAGCETVGSAAGARQYAVLETDTTGATSSNIASLSEVVQRNPNDAAAYTTRGAAYARAGQFNEAIADFTKAIQLDPNSASAYNNRALASRQIGRDSAALQDFSKAIAIDPNYGPAYIGRANVERAQGNLDGALGDLNVAIRLSPESAEAYHARGLVKQKQGLDTQAIADFDAAIDRNPFVSAPYAARGQSLIATNQYPKAIEDYNAALNVNNKDATSWAYRGWPTRSLASARRRWRITSALPASMRATQSPSPACRASRAASAPSSTEAPALGGEPRQERGGLQGVVAGLGGEAGEIGGDPVKAGLVGPVHRAAPPRRPIVAIDPDRIDVAGPRRDALLEDARALIDHRVHQPRHDLVGGEAAPGDAVFGGDPPDQRLDLRVSRAGACALGIEVEPSPGLLAVAAHLGEGIRHGCAAPEILARRQPISSPARSLMAKGPIRKPNSVTAASISCGRALRGAGARPPDCCASPESGCRRSRSTRLPPPGAC